MNEKEFTYEILFTYLKEKYYFNPRNFMVDFALGQIKAINSVFPEYQIHSCFFHFSQSIWKNFKKYNLCGKGTYEDNYELLFNIQILCFIERERISNFYKLIVKKYKDKKCKNFFNYFAKTWLGNRFPKSLWNYNDVVLGDDTKLKYFNFTNNLCENINRYLNRFLKNGICSNFLFRTSILNIIDQFENKTINQTIENKKSDILSFYIKNNKIPKLLDNADIKNLADIYNEIKFNNINKDYVELDECNIDILQYEEEDESIDS